MTIRLSKGLTPLGAVMAHLQLGRFAQAERAGRAALRADSIALAKLAGDRGTAATPMDNARRAENYRRQRGGLAPVLTDRQRRRLRKNTTRGQHLPYVAGQMTGADLDAMYAARRNARIRRGYAS